MRTLLAALVLAASAPALADPPNCERLDRPGNFDDGLDLGIHDDELVVELDGSEHLRIDAEHRVYVDGEELAVPAAARPAVAAYRAGFLKLEREAMAIGKEGAKIGIDAMTGLFRVLFTAETIDDYERRIEARGEAIERKADDLCAVVLELEDVERDVLRDVPGFPAVLTRHAGRDL